MRRTLELVPLALEQLQHNFGQTAAATVDLLLGEVKERIDNAQSLRQLLWVKVGRV